MRHGGPHVDAARAQVGDDPGALRVRLEGLVVADRDAAEPRVPLRQQRARAFDVGELAHVEDIDVPRRRAGREHGFVVDAERLDGAGVREREALVPGRLVEEDAVERHGGVEAAAQRRAARELRVGAHAERPFRPGLQGLEAPVQPGRRLRARDLQGDVREAPIGGERAHELVGHVVPVRLDQHRRRAGDARPEQRRHAVQLGAS